MADSPRIPRKIDLFNQYISNTTPYFNTGTPTNAERLGIRPEEVTQWIAIDTRWKPTYSLYSDKKNSRTTSVIEEINLIITDLIDLDHTYHLLDRIAASPNVNITDLETFNIKKGVLEKTTRSKPTTPITELVVPALQPLGGGIISMKCRNHIGNSASIIDGADSVEYNYCVGGTRPTSAESVGLKTGLSTKASFTLSLGAESAKEELFIFFRWYNTKHPELAGPWSSVQTTLIL
jgi:hypothetical protein